MKIARRFTTAGMDPYAGIDFTTTSSEIRNPDGSVVFKRDDIEVPAAWSQVACDILAQKYFRRAGIPAVLRKVREKDVPQWLWREAADEAALAALPEDQQSTSEMRRIGAGRVTILIVKPMHGPITTKCAICWRGKCLPRTRRSGSTPAYIGPMALMARHKGIFMLISTPAN